MEEKKLTARGRATRQRIIEATGEQILASGIGGTTLDTVRAATLTSKSQLFHYFPGGKAELVREVAAWEGGQLLAAQQPHVDDLSSWESWSAWREALVDYYLGLGRWACPIGSLATQAAMTDPELERVIAESMGAWRDLLAAGVRKMQASGDVDREADPERIAMVILTAVQGGLVMSQPLRSAWPLEAALDSALDPLHRVRV
ncbi:MULTISPECIES: TetR/AcrR family transcriptional regulator [unclassified Frigoribacterium]|uniref:TetR/AcrR family transcriptional regulator n=1 Tax=unclassified Frigoribacterium TaxID=2627005 RepID=UPI0006F69C95|nr:MULTISPECIES: TetR/AcrR family transcriptional regulator [unclassified Frigoribacterium]KQO79493.1 TetR family transcriptional regulator [Frigoribacterium sp. Leaf263]KQR61984.1 TetR family transcriptional regulator [Frigoribacterium sp. Leaf172]